MDRCEPEDFQVHNESGAKIDYGKAVYLAGVVNDLHDEFAKRLSSDRFLESTDTELILSRYYLQLEPTKEEHEAVLSELRKHFRAVAERDANWAVSCLEFGVTRPE